MEQERVKSFSARPPYQQADQKQVPGPASAIPNVVTIHESRQGSNGTPSAYCLPR
jgi:hypothetical protein